MGCSLFYEVFRVFPCHMNAEIRVSHFESIKCQFKYVRKGSGRASVYFSEEGQDINEIDQFIVARYISA